MPLQCSIPIGNQFEAHLCVCDAIEFYGNKLSLPLAHVVPARKVAFFWIGGTGKSMRGLWQTRTLPGGKRAHIAFELAEVELQTAPARLRRAGIQPLDFAGGPIEEAVVLPWMPAASVYFHDPDNNLLEFITMMPGGPPRPALDPLSWVESTATRQSRIERTC